MYVPKRNSLRDRIALCICANGPMSMVDIARAFEGRRYNTVSNAVHQLKFYNGVTLESGIYSLTDELQAHYSGVPLPPKTTTKLEPRPWKPLSEKNMAWCSPLIAERLRNDFHPLTCASSVKYSAE